MKIESVDYEERARRTARPIRRVMYLACLLLCTCCVFCGVRSFKTFDVFSSDFIRVRSFLSWYSVCSLHGYISVEVSWFTTPYYFTDRAGYVHNSFPVSQSLVDEQRSQTGFHFSFALENWTVYPGGQRLRPKIGVYAFFTRPVRSLFISLPYWFLILIFMLPLLIWVFRIFRTLGANRKRVKRGLRQASSREEDVM